MEDVLEMPDSEDILFRIWLMRSSGQIEGAVDLMRKSSHRHNYSDSLEAEIIEDQYGILRLTPRNRGRDIPAYWCSLIEINLLTPISMKAIRPYQQHVFGEGRLRKVIFSKVKSLELQLQDVRIISPKDFQNRSGDLIGDDWPDTYELPPPLVFLCHSSKDKPFVRRLSEELKENNVQVWLDEEEILVGQSFIEKMQKGIKEADFVAVILTPNFLIGPWANRELEMALDHEVRSREVRILPILREDCEIPGFLGSKSYADFRGDNFDNGIKVLLRSILGLQREQNT